MSEKVIDGYIVLDVYHAGGFRYVDFYKTGTSFINQNWFDLKDDTMTAEEFLEFLYDTYPYVTKNNQ